jgi:hypothetical protein
MRTVRRLYFYLVALISLEVVVWGVISLARNLFDEVLVGGAANLMATGLSLLLVGIPIFLLHWMLAQRDARRDSEEHDSRVRALFLYAARFGLLTPVAQNLLALISRAALSIFREDFTRALIGSGQTFADNVVAIVVNLVIWVYIEQTLRRDWAEVKESDALVDVRRLYRYVWVLYALLLVCTGVYQVVHYIFFVPEGVTGASAGGLANGLALALVGAPLWAWTWKVIQDSLPQPGERASWLRQIVLYLLSLVGLGGTLASAAVLLALVLRWALGDAHTLSTFFSDASNSLAFLAAFGIVWAYYGRERRLALADVGNPARRSALERFYAYILSLAGNISTYFGLAVLLNTLVEMAMSHAQWPDVYRTSIANCLATLAVGLPLWLTNWPAQQAQARQQDLVGEQARRSVLRKGYLYLVLFSTVIGAMGTAGSIFFLVLSTLLGNNPEANFWLAFNQRGVAFIQVGVWLAYHLRMLLQDGKFAQRTLRDRHAGFSTLILQSNEGHFSGLLTAALQQQAPHIPVRMCSLEDGSINEALGTSSAVVLPAGLALQPPEGLRAGLETFAGQRIVVPEAAERWTWLGAAPRGERDLAKETARAVRLLAEGQEFQPAGPANAWSVVGYVLGVLFALQILMVLAAIGINLVAR